MPLWERMAGFGRVPSRFTTDDAPGTPIEDGASSAALWPRQHPTSKPLLLVADRRAGDDQHPGVVTGAEGHVAGSVRTFSGGEEEIFQGDYKLFYEFRFDAAPVRDFDRRK